MCWSFLTAFCFSIFPAHHLGCPPPHRPVSVAHSVHTGHLPTLAGFPLDTHTHTLTHSVLLHLLQKNKKRLLSSNSSPLLHPGPSPGDGATPSGTALLPPGVPLTPRSGPPSTAPASSRGHWRLLVSQPGGRFALVLPELFVPVRAWITPPTFWRRPCQLPL